MSVLSFEGVTLTLGRRTVLAGVSFAIGRGEMIGVLGPNGAGKTTLMRAALGLVRPGAGRIEVDGKPPWPGRADVGYMPQIRAAGSPLRLSGRAFVGSAWHGARPGLPRLGAAGAAAVQRALALAAAGDLADRPVAALSGGERQRLRLAQALLGTPALLLLDEPLISLDPGHQAGVVGLARRLVAEHGMTVLFSAHELNPLMGALDRVLYLAGGQAALGTVDEVVTGPVLSRLYGAPIEVVRAEGRIFVMSGGEHVERGECSRHV